MFSTIPNPPPELQELRLKLREMLANIGYCMAAGMGTEISIETIGEQEQEAMQALLKLIADKFDEGQ